MKTRKCKCCGKKFENRISGGNYCMECTREALKIDKIKGIKNENNLQIAQNATSAQEAAQLISRNNRSEVGGHMLGMFLIGLGAALSGASVIGMIAEKNKKKKV